MKKLTIIVGMFLLYSMFIPCLSAVTQDDMQQNEENVTATLELLEDVEGRLFVKKESGNIVTDIIKKHGMTKRISLEPGHYSLTLQFEKEKYIIKSLILKDNKVVRLGSKDFILKRPFGRKVKRFFKKRTMQKNTLLKGNKKVHFFLESSMKSVKLNNERQLFMGGNIGIILGEKLIIGFGGQGNVTLGTHHKDYLDQEVLVGYGGVLLGYNFNPRDVVNFRISGLFGAGAESKVGDRHKDDENRDYEHGDHKWDHNRDWDHWGWDIYDFDLYDGQVFFLFEPQVDVFINLTSHFKLNISASYRFVDSDKSDLKGFSFGCGFQFNI